MFRSAPVRRRGVLIALIVALVVPLSAAITYSPPSFVTTGLGPSTITAADFNGDGKVDFATGNAFAAPGSEITIGFGNGAGAFPTTSTFAAPRVPHNILAADMDNDGDMDLVLTTTQSFSDGSNAVHVLLNNGAATFSPLGPGMQSCDPVQTTFCDIPTGVAVADLNEDGWKDIIVSDANASNAVTLFLSNGAGGFNAATHPVLPVGSNNAFDVVAADFNGDDHMDVAVPASVSGPPNTQPTGVIWLLGNGDGTFDPAQVFYFPFTIQGEHGAIAITAGDVDNDGDIDTATSSGNTPGGASVFVNDGTGLAAGVTWHQFTMNQAAANPIDVILADLDGDGFLDIATADQFGIPPWGSNLAARPGNGDGTFGAAVAISVGYTNGIESHWNPKAIVGVDLNCDGKADLIAANENKDFVSVMLAGNGGGGGVDTTPPVISAPGNLTLATASCPLHVSDADLGTATASDNCASVSVVRTGVPAGNNFPIGTTTITYTATDGSGNTSTATQTVTVVDNTPPVISAPADVNVTAGASCVANVDPGTAAATDGCGGASVSGVRSDAQPLNAPYPIGTTTITWTATDGSGNSSTATQAINVAAPPPVISGVSASPSSLWPPNHIWVDVTIAYTATSCGSVSCVISSITSNEPEDGLGDGDTGPDWQIVDNHHVRLRAERAGGGSGRVYTIVIACTDSYGNTTTTSVTVSVPAHK